MHYFKQFEHSNENDLKEEALAQYDRFYKIFHKYPNFINVHHDLDKCYFLKDILNRLFPNLPSRAQREENNLLNYFYLSNFLSPYYTFAESEKKIFFLFREGMIKYNEINNSIIEIVFHPAFFSKELDDFSTYSRMREIEFQVLSSNKIFSMLSVFYNWRSM